MGRNVEVIVSFGGLHEKHAVQRGVLGTNSALRINRKLSFRRHGPHRKLRV
jgi:hypothetical protein